MISKFSNKLGKHITKKLNKEAIFPLKETQIYFNFSINIKSNVKSQIKKSVKDNDILREKHLAEKNIQSQKFSKLFENEKVKIDRNTSEKEIERTKLREENREMNITRRSTLKKDKEIQYQNKNDNKDIIIEEVYTEEEYQNLISDKGNNEMIIYRMASFHKSDHKEFAKIILIGILPLCFFGSFLIDYIFPFTKKGVLMNLCYYSVLFCDYGIFLYFILRLLQMKGRTSFAKYIQKDKIVEFTKFTIFGNDKICIENLSDLKRITTNNTILSKLSSKKTNNEYNFYKDIQEINDRKLFNYIFPKVEVKTRKKPSMVDSLWDKN